MNKTLTLLLISAVCALPGAALAQNTTWTNYSGSNNGWLNPTNWNNGVPVATSTALLNTVPAGTSYVVDHSGTNNMQVLRLGNSTSQTVTLNVADGSLLTVANSTMPSGLGDNTFQTTAGARMNITGAVIMAGGVYFQGDSQINIHGGSLIISNRSSRINDTGAINVLDGGRFVSQSSFELAGAGGAGDRPVLNVANGSAVFGSISAGARGSGTVVIAASGVWTNTGALQFGVNPPTGNHPGVGVMISTGNVFSSGDIYLGRNRTNANSFGSILVAGGTFRQMGANRIVRIGEQNKGFLTVEGGSFISTNNLLLGVNNRNEAAGLMQRGDGTVLVTGTGAMAVTNAAGTASITLGTASAVADADRAIGRLTVASGSLDADVVRVQNGVFTNSGGTSTIGNLLATTNTAAIAFTGGTLNLGASTINNGQAMVVGDGIGAATLNLTGNGAHSFAGGLLLSANSLLAGAGTITGSLTNFGTIAPGSSPGIIAVNGDAVLTDTSLLLMELAGTGAGDFDQFNVTGLLGFDGTLTVTLTNGFTPQIGDIFDLFDFGSTNGLAFDTVNLPDLVGAVWDTTDLYVGGSIAVVIPEPGTFALLGIGALLLLLAPRRRRPIL